MTATIHQKNWNTLAENSQIEKTVKALEANGITVFVVDNATAAKLKVLDLIPDGAEVFTAASATLTESGIAQEINESGRYRSVRKQMQSMNRETQFIEMRRLGATPEFVVGSVQALTEKGQAMIASFGGSQLPAYAYGAGKVIWVVSTQKIVEDLDEGLRRIEEHCLPLESDRLQKAVGRTSEIGKLLIVKKEAQAGRITLILVKEKLGF